MLEILFGVEHKERGNVIHYFTFLLQKWVWEVMTVRHVVDRYKYKASQLFEMFVNNVLQLVRKMKARTVY